MGNLTFFFKSVHSLIKNRQFCQFLIIVTLTFLSPLSFAADALSIFIKEVLEHNPGIKAAESNVIAAQARIKASSYYLYNPELTAEYQNAIENTRSVGVNQTFDWANKRGARKNVSCANLDIAQAQLALLRQEIITKTLNALAQYHAAKDVVILAKKRSAVLQQFAGISARLFKNGDIARVELDLSQLALSESLAQQANTEFILNEALETLRAVTGLYRTTWPCLPSSLPHLFIDKIDVKQLSTSVPAVDVLHQQYIAAIARIKLAERERFPDPTIGIQGGYQIESGRRKNLYGLTLSIPLFILNPYLAEIDAANFDAMEAAQKRADIFRQTKAAIISSAERYQTLYVATQKWRNGSTKPLSNGDILIQKLWRAGEITTTDYLVQVKQRIDSQIAGVELYGRAWQAWIDWLKASGQAETWLQQKICT